MSILYTNVIFVVKTKNPLEEEASGRKPPPPPPQPYEAEYSQRDNIASCFTIAIEWSMQKFILFSEMSHAVL